MSASLTPQQLLNFYKESEKLKNTLRHSWLSSGKRQESVAEHTWMMAMLAMILLPRMRKPLDGHKVLRMIIVHDLAEAVTQDMPVWQGEKDKKGKTQAEREAITNMLAQLDARSSQELLEVWEEYEIRASDEAQFVKALDTLDVITQHNVTDSNTWDDNDYLWQLSPIQNEYFEFDPFLKEIKKEIDKWSIEKVKHVGKLDKLDQAELKKRLGQDEK